MSTIHGSAGFRGILVAAAAIVAVPLAAHEEPAEIALDFSPVFVHQTEITHLGENVFELRTTGNDSYLIFELPAIPDPSATPILAFDYFSTTGVDSLEIRLADQGDWQPTIDAGGLNPAQGWSAAGLPLSEPGNRYWNGGKARRLRIDWGQAGDRAVRIRQWRLRGLTPEERTSAAEKVANLRKKKQRAAAIARYLAADDPAAVFPGSIGQVSATAEQITITGRRPRDGRAYLLAEVPITTSAVVPGHRERCMALTDQRCDAGGQFTIPVPRFDSGRDRLTSRWQIVVAPTNVPASPAVYPTDLSGLAASALPPPPRLRNAKGMGGISPVFGLPELVDLGVRHITVNVIVTDLLSETPHGNSEPFEHNGRTWWFNTRRLAHVDQAVAFATRNNIVVALIILLPTRSQDILVHPEATSNGIYAMPNLDDASAAEKYTAVMGALAQRYSGGEHGRVDHWIMHNEVDFGWIWTNMGEQPVEVYMDALVRSMRIAYLQARRYNPFAQVFISLTHHWNVPEDQRMRTYAPREMLEILSDWTRREGEFQWGVAYHPYPQDLFNPRTWEDSQVSDDFDTRLITMKNIQVLERFLRQPSMLDGTGQMRTVLLSEQGYHTDGYGEEAQRLQGAALLYTWERLRATDFVYAYDYHRWVDAAEEGGLLLGLRTVGDSSNPAGKPKLAWDVFRDIGTDEEDQWRQRLESIYKPPND